jgi:secreted trypsin-like serine protease
VGGVFEGKYSPTAGGGDSGGPAICRGPNGRALLCGVTSFGGDDELCKAYTDEETCTPSTYVEVAHFHDWIQKTAGDQDPKTFYQPYLYGRTIQLSQHEHQVHITSKNGNSCGGTLIAPDVVITAAQCVSQGGNKNSSGENFSNLTVTFGLDEVTGKGQPFQVKGVAVLPGFRLDSDLVTASKVENRVIVSDNYYKNDLAVIKLAGGVSSNVTFPKLPKQGYQPRQGYEFAFPRNTTYSAQISQRLFRFLNREECQRRMDRMSRIGFNFQIEKELLCGVETYSGGSTCDRELGGGVLCKGEGEGGVYDTLCGVQIFRLCEFSIPNGFINVALNSDWIQRVMGQL